MICQKSFNCLNINLDDVQKEIGCYTSTHYRPLYATANAVGSTLTAVFVLTFAYAIHWLRKNTKKRIILEIHVGPRHDV